MKKRTTKRALVMSFLALLLCCSMLVGMTFAWFTDSVASGTNRILAGKLDIEVTVNTQEDKSLDAEDLKLFGDVEKWEPGVVAYETLTIKNAGNLALKYDLYVNVADYNTVNGHNLTEVIKIAMIEGTVDEAAGRDALIESVEKWAPISTTAHVEGAKLSKEDERVVTLVAYWEPTGRDNDYNLKNELRDAEELYINFSVVVAATQAMEESDSFNNEYDKDATIPGIKTVTAAINQGATDANAALKTAANGTVYFDDELTYDAETNEYTIMLHFEKGSLDYINETYNAVLELIAKAALEHAENIVSVNIAGTGEITADQLDEDGMWVENALREAVGGQGGFVGALEAAQEFGLPVEFVDINGNKATYRMLFDLNWGTAEEQAVIAAIKQGAEDANDALAEETNGTIYFDEDGLKWENGELVITLHFGEGSVDYINEAYNAVKALIEEAVEKNVESIESINIAYMNERTDFTGEWLEEDLRSAVGGQGGFAGALEAAAEYGLPVEINTKDGGSQVYRMNFDLSGLQAQD